MGPRGPVSQPDRAIGCRKVGPGEPASLPGWTAVTPGVAAGGIGADLKGLKYHR